MFSYGLSSTHEPLGTASSLVNVIMASSPNPNEHVDESCDDGCSSDDNLAGFKSALSQRLDQVKTAGSFATAGSFGSAGKCSSVSLLPLDVEGYGLVGFPLTETTAKALINICHRAPFGKGILRFWRNLCRLPANGCTGSETIVNESVRKTWELDPTDFIFVDPNWDPSVQRTARTAAHELGYAEGASIKAELYKLLLYEEGAMFKAHQE